MPRKKPGPARESRLTSLSSGSRELSEIPLGGPTPAMTPQAAAYLRQRLAKPPDGRHDPRSVFGSGLTMERIQATIYQADWGNPRSLCDLSRETLQIDPHLASVLGKRFGAVATLPITILPAKGPGIDHERAAFYAEVVRSMFDRIPNMRQAVKQLAWGLFDGRSVLEKIWAIVPGQSHPRFGRVTSILSGLSWIHPRRIFFGPDRELRVVDRPIGIGFSRDGKALNEAEHHFVEFTPQLFCEYPEREGLARACLYWSFFKRFGARERMILLELFSKPWRWGEIGDEEDLSPTDRDDLDTVVEQMAGNGWGVLPRGTKLHVESIAQQFGANGTIHKEVIDHSDAQLSKLVLGQTGTTDAKPMGLGGSQAPIMADEQTQICIDDAGMIEEVLEDFISDDIISVNFGPGAVTHAPKVKLHVDTKDRVREIARVKAGLEIGLEVALEEAYEVSGFRTPSEDEPVLKIETPSGKGGGGGVGPDGLPLPAAPAQARAVILYPPGDEPAQRVQEAPPPVSDGLPALPGGSPKAPEGGLPALPAPGPADDGNAVVKAPDEGDPSQTANSEGATETEPDPIDATEPKPAAPAADVTTPEASPDAARAGVATDGDMSDKYSPANNAGGGVGDYPDPEKEDKVPRGVMGRPPRRTRAARASSVRAVSDAYHIQNEPLLPPEQPKDDSPTPEPGRSPAPPDVQAPTMVPVELPIGPYADFDACVVAQVGKGHSDASARKICGALKDKVEGAVTVARRASGGIVTEKGAKLLVRALGEVTAKKIFLSMKTLALRETDEAACVLCGKGMKQPSTVYGSPEPIVKKAVKELAGQTRDWANKLIDAAKGKETPAAIYAAIYAEAHRVNHDEFGRALQRRILHSEMLGFLDSHFETNTDETIAPAKFDRRAWVREITLLGPENVTKVSPTFSDLSYKPATEFFKKKEIMPKASFEALEDGAKLRAFTIARTESRSILDLVHAELGRMVSEGADLKEFRKFMKARIESAGWTPASPSHVETIARTNLMQAYTVGRVVHDTQPAVLADRPYWQIRGVKDNRQRANHGAVVGWVLRADDPFFQQAMPGCWGFNDRCRHTTLSAKQVEKRGLEIHKGSEITDLPDKGFSGGGLNALLSAHGAK